MRKRPKIMKANLQNPVTTPSNELWKSRFEVRLNVVDTIHTVKYGKVSRASLVADLLAATARQTLVPEQHAATAEIIVTPH